MFNLDTVLLSFAHGSTPFTIREAVEGVQIFGGIGSGKTSGSGATLARKYLSSGFGGLVLTAKREERQLWESYCKTAGRSHDLVIIEPRGKAVFNFLDYESTSRGQSGSFTENLVQVLKTVIRAGEDKKGGPGGDDNFWEEALDMLLFNVIDLCQLAYGSVTIQHLYDIATTAPSPSRNQTRQPDGSLPDTAFNRAFKRAIAGIKTQIDIAEQELTQERLAELSHSEQDYEDWLFEAVPQSRLMKSVDQFFTVTYWALSEKTRSIIEFTFIGFLFRLLREPVYSLFCRYQSTVTPDMSLKGKIILLDLPVKQFDKVGRDCQILFKYIWQKAMERRDVTRNDRPVFLWADEAQNFIHEYDAEYQATARSSRIATVYLSQNLPNYFANMGGGKSEFRVKSFLGTLSMKIFHANADIDTNNYASDLIGEAYTVDHSRSVTMAGQFSTSKSTAYSLEKMVRPERFGLLKTGGPANNLISEAIVHRQGRAFSTGFNHEKISFQQLSS